MDYLTDDVVEAACARLEKAIEAARNSNSAAEAFVVAASSARHLAPIYAETLDSLAQLAASAISAVEGAEKDTNWGTPMFGPTNSEALESELEDLHEPLADLFIYLSGKRVHASDCATSNAPAYLPRKCDCDLLAKDQTP